MPKAVMVIIDGLTDESESYPFSYPDIAFGRFVTTPQGALPESYPCIATLLGVPAGILPKRARGYLEAVGANIEVMPGDLVLRASWMSLSDGRVTSPLPTGEQPLLPDGYFYRHIGDYRSVVIVKGAAEAIDSVLSSPPFAFSGSPISEVIPQSPILSEIVRATLKSDRVLIPWGESVPCSLPKLCRGYTVVCSALIVKGLALSLGARCLADPSFTGDVDTDLAKKAKLALKSDGDMAVVHINGADEAAHRQNARQKAQFVKRIAHEVISPIKKSGTPLLICCDHGCSPITGRHTGGEQPFWLINTVCRGDLGTHNGNSAAKLLLEGSTCPLA